MVRKEILQGHVQEDLWIQALAEGGTDEKKVKARYIELRIWTLQKALANTIGCARTLAISGQPQSMEEAKAKLRQSRKRTRTRIRAIGFWMPFFVVAIFIFLFVTDERKNLITNISFMVWASLFPGIVGFTIGEIILRLMPSQRQLTKEEEKARTLAIPRQPQSREEAKLRQLRKRTRTRIRAIGFWIPFFVVGIPFFLLATDERYGLVINISSTVAAGILPGMLGFTIGEIILKSMPSQRQLIEEEWHRVRRRIFGRLQPIVVFAIFIWKIIGLLS